MKTAVLAISSRPYLALLAIVGVCVFPAANMTVAEWKDAVDASATTAWQPELVIDAWFDCATKLAIGIFSFLNRNSLLETKPEIPPMP